MAEIITHGSACPYCGYHFAQSLRAKQLCPACKLMILMKSTPGDCVKRPMTERNAKEADKLWAIHDQRREHLWMLYPFALDARHIEERIALGQSETSAVRSLLSDVAEKSPDLHKRQLAFFTLAALADKEGQPFSEFLTKRTLWQLLHLKRSSVKRVSILTGGRSHACARCVATNGEVWDIDEALKVMPIPRLGCTWRSSYSNRTGYCTCLWVAHVGNAKRTLQ